MVLAISTLVTNTKKTQKVILDRVSYIYFSVQVQKDKEAIIQAPIYSGSKVNTIILAYAKRLGFWVWKLDVGAQKIDRLLLKIFKMMIVSFQVIDKLKNTIFPKNIPIC